MSQVKALLLDSDGTILHSSLGNSRLVAAIRRSFLRNARWLYVLGEILDAYVLRTKYALHEGARDLIRKAQSKGVVVGIVTDRSLFSFVMSAQAASLELSLFDFIHARKSALDRFVYHKIAYKTYVVRTKKFKGQKGALDRLMKHLSIRRIKNSDMLFVGDSNVDVLVAAQYSIPFLKVDGNAPNFSPVTRTLCRE